MKSLAWVALAGVVALAGCSSPQKVEQVPAGPGARASYGVSAIPAGGSGSEALPAYGAAGSAGMSASSALPGTPGMGPVDTGDMVAEKYVGPTTVQPKPVKAAATPKAVKATKVVALPAKSVKATSYVVKKGDTLTGIAKKIYGNANDWKKIAKANKITDPNKIVVGQKLKLP